MIKEELLAPTVALSKRISTVGIGSIATKAISKYKYVHWMIHW